MNDAFSNYCLLEKELRAVQLKNDNVESQEENAILAIMDSVLSSECTVCVPPLPEEPPRKWVFLSQEEAMTLLECMVRSLEEMASKNPNRPLGDYWLLMRRNADFNKALAALLMNDQKALEEVARVGLPDIVVKNETL